jgi:hypothetical protein
MEIPRQCGTNDKRPQASMVAAKGPNKLATEAPSKHPHPQRSVHLQLKLTQASTLTDHIPKIYREQLSSSIEVCCSCRTCYFHIYHNSASHCESQPFSIIRQTRLHTGKPPHNLWTRKIQTCHDLLVDHAHLLLGALPPHTYTVKTSRVACLHHRYTR